MTDGNTKKSRKFFKKVKIGKRQALVGILLTAIVAGAIYVFSGWGYQAFYVQPREARIKAIYESLNLDDSYTAKFVDISGEKRLYEWDKNRSYSSQIQYLKGADVKTTVKELDEKITAIGFEKFDEPYAGGANIQYHYKSAKGEYIRLNVSSKLRDDAFQNYFLMNRDAKEYPKALIESDTNAGPSNVTIKVNLDDNNE